MLIEKSLIHQQIRKSSGLDAAISLFQLEDDENVMLGEELIKGMLGKRPIELLKQMAQTCIYADAVEKTYLPAEKLFGLVSFPMLGFDIDMDCFDDLGGLKEFVMAYVGFAKIFYKVELYQEVGGLFDVLHEDFTKEVWPTHDRLKVRVFDLKLLLVWAEFVQRVDNENIQAYKFFCGRHKHDFGKMSMRRFNDNFVKTRWGETIEEFVDWYSSDQEHALGDFSGEWKEGFFYDNFYQIGDYVFTKEENCDGCY